MNHSVTSREEILKASRELMAQKGRYYSLYTHQYRSEAQRAFRA